MQLSNTFRSPSRDPLSLAIRRLAKAGRVG
jgi:hypothetical protein